MCSVYENRIIDSIDYIGNLGSRSRSNLLDFFDSVEFVTGIDSFGRIAGEEVLVELETAYTLHYGQAFLFGHAGVDSRFVNHYIPLRYDFTYGFGCAPKRLEIRTIVVIDRSRDSNDIEITVLDVIQICCATEAVIIECILKKFIAYFKSRIMSGIKSIDTFLIHVESYSRIYS